MGHAQDKDAVYLHNAAGLGIDGCPGFQPRGMLPVLPDRNSRRRESGWAKWASHSWLSWPGGPAESVRSGTPWPKTNANNEMLHEMRKKQPATKGKIWNRCSRYFSNFICKFLTWQNNDCSDLKVPAMRSLVSTFLSSFYKKFDNERYPKVSRYRKSPKHIIVKFPLQDPIFLV